MWNHAPVLQRHLKTTEGALSLQLLWFSTEGNYPGLKLAERLWEL